MELELKHLANYLPYELKVVHTNYIEFGKAVERVDTLKGLYEDCCTFSLGADWYFNTDENDCSFKPILRQLSEFGDSDDLRKVHEFIGLGQWCEAYDHYFDAWFNDACSIDKLVLQAPYEVVQYFFVNHFDVFGLIAAGLAVDVNTLSANQSNINCSCLKCLPNEMPNIRFNVCKKCGNKRCPHATDHNYECTNSNEVGQIGWVSANGS